MTNAADEIDARNYPGFGAAVTNVFDFDKNGIVSASDQIIARNNAGFMFRIDIGNLPAAPEAVLANSTGDDGSGSAVASALTIPSLPERPDNRLMITTRPSSIEPRGDPTASFFQHLGEADGPHARALSTAVEDAFDALDLDDDLLESLLRDL